MQPMSQTQVRKLNKAIRVATFIAGIALAALISAAMRMIVHSP